MKILIAKTYFEKDKGDAEKYLEYNGYGSVKNIEGTDLYLCLLGDEKPNDLNDVKIIDRYTVKSEVIK